MLLFVRIFNKDLHDFVYLMLPLKSQFGIDNVYICILIPIYLQSFCMSTSYDGLQFPIHPENT